MDSWWFVMAILITIAVFIFMIGVATNMIDLAAPSLTFGFSILAPKAIEKQKKKGEMDMRYKILLAVVSIAVGIGIAFMLWTNFANEASQSGPSRFAELGKLIFG